MSNPFFDHPILNSPYERPQRHWELDAQGQPTQQIIGSRGRADFITATPERSPVNDAEQYLSEAARIITTSSDVQEHLGYLYEKRGQMEQARAAWQRALEMTSMPAQKARLIGKLKAEKKK